MLQTAAQERGRAIYCSTETIAWVFVSNEKEMGLVCVKNGRRWYAKSLTCHDS